MGDRCNISLEKSEYAPGDRVHGNIDFNCSKEYKVREIRIRFKGIAKVQWSAGRNSTRKAEDPYFEMECNLLTQETTFPPGKYSYPFTYELPCNLPSSMTTRFGSVTYSVKGTIDMPWARDFDTKVVFLVMSYNDLNNIDEVRKPVEMSAQNKPLLFFGTSDPILFYVRLPVGGYVPSQMMKFYARIQNASSFPVECLRFHIVQGFTLYAGQYSSMQSPDYSGSYIKTHEIFTGQSFEIIDSLVVAKSERSWDDLEIRIPAGIFNGSMGFCRIIKAFCELRGEAVLPFGHKNIKIRIPITIGSVPLSE